MIYLYKFMRLPCSKLVSNSQNKCESLLIPTFDLILLSINPPLYFLQNMRYEYVWKKSIAWLCDCLQLHICKPVIC